MTVVFGYNLNSNPQHYEHMAQSHDTAASMGCIMTHMACVVSS